MGSRAGLDGTREENSFCSCRNSKLEPSSLWTVAIPTELPRLLYVVKPSRIIVNKLFQIFSAIYEIQATRNCVRM